MNYPPVNGVEIISATTSGGASTLALDIVRRYIAEMPEAEGREPEHDYMYASANSKNGSYSKPLNAARKVARKNKNKMQKASRRANR